MTTSNAEKRKALGSDLSYCKQPGHYARGCAVRRSQSPTKGTSTRSKAHECIDSVPHSDAQTITINSVSNYSVPAVVFDSQVLFETS